MIAFACKKLFRDERLWQMILLLSVLRGTTDDLFDCEDILIEPLYDGHSLGPMLGRNMVRIPPLQDLPHQKSLDRVLANYQRSIIEDLHNLGRLSTSSRPRDVHAYLLNAESAFNEVQTRSTSAIDSFSRRLEDDVISTESSTESNSEHVPFFDHDLLTDLEDISVDENLLQEIYGDHMTNGAVGNISLDEIDFQTRFNRYAQDLEELEAIWKQDVDLGVPRQFYDDESEDEAMDESCKDTEALIDFQFNKEKDPGKEPGGRAIAELTEDKPWQVMNYTIDSETGELLAANESDDTDPTLNFDSPPSLQLNEDDPNFNLDFNLDEALNLVEFGAEGTEIKDSSETDSGYCDVSFSDRSANSSSPDLDAINASIDEMLQTSHLHGHRNVQGRLGGLVRSGSMEQRWQDLASLLSLPSPDAQHGQSPTPSMASHGTSPIHTHSHSHLPQPIHHPHALYANHESPAASGQQAGVSRGVLLHNTNLPLPMSDHSAHNITYSNSMGASSHLVASSMNLANNSDMAVDHHYKMETNNMTADMMYYQQQQQQQQQHQHNSTPEITQSNDGIWSSILNEEELQLMDIGMNDYNGRGNGEYGANNYRYNAAEDPQRHPQKKHHLYGKRFFHENSPTTGGSNLTQGNPSIGGPPVGVPLVGGYAPHYPPAPIENTTMNPSEMKYSCSMDFRTPDVTGNNLDHVQHNHTYHLSSDGPSGMGRPIKDKKGRRTEQEKNLTRDEKKARLLSLPITCEDIINLPMDEFNERISKFDLSEAQLSLIRDIRRRGKNKVAAQNCRKRKLDQIVHLAEEVKVIQYRKTELRSQMDHLTSERARVKHKFSILYRHIFQSLRDADGNPYSPHDFSLQQSADGSILLVPRSSAHQSMDSMSKNRNTKKDPSP